MRAVVVIFWLTLVAACGGNPCPPGEEPGPLHTCVTPVPLPVPMPAPATLSGVLTTTSNDGGVSPLCSAPLVAIQAQGDAGVSQHLGAASGRQVPWTASVLPGTYAITVTTSLECPTLCSGAFCHGASQAIVSAPSGASITNIDFALIP